MMRDAKINLELILDLGQSEVLPVQISEFAADMTKRLEVLVKTIGKEFDMNPILDGWAALFDELSWLGRQAEEGNCSDEDMKETIGRLIHLIYCRQDPYRHDFGAGFGIFGAFFRYKGIDRSQVSAQYYAMAESDFLRSRNRLWDGMKEIAGYIRRKRQNREL